LGKAPLFSTASEKEVGSKAQVVIAFAAYIVIHPQLAVQRNHGGHPFDKLVLGKIFNY
jgi:hypothetical protein